ncbi:MAG: transposase [Halioglobus sp.]|jgi:transposase
MSGQRYTPEFKDEAVKQVLDRGYSVAEVSERLGVTPHSLYKWVNAVKPENSTLQATELLEAKREILKLKSDLKRTEVERDILKKAAVDSTCQCNTLIHNLYWRSKFQCFSRPLI